MKSLHMKHLIKSLSYMFEMIKLLKRLRSALQCRVISKIPTNRMKTIFCFVFNCFACGGNTFFEMFPQKGLVLTSEHRFLSGTVLNKMPSKINPTFINRYKAFQLMESNCAFKSFQCTCSSAMLKYISVIIYFQKRHVQMHHVLMAVHVLYLAVVIAVPVCQDLEVHNVKV